MAQNKKIRGGFTLVEILIYTAIFAVSAVFLLNILTSTTRIQIRQSSQNEVNQQITFVASTIQKLVRDSSMIQNEAGVSSSTLMLRMPSSSLDPTKIFVDASSTAVYVQQGTGLAIALTNDKVSVGNFSVTKFESSGGLAVVQVDLALDYKTTNPQAKFTRTWRSAISRISAANFDYSIVPNANNSYDFGNSSNNWRDAYFGGSIGLGTSPVSGAKIKSTGDFGFTTSSVGIILMSPSSTCYRLGISNIGNIATSSVACP